ncbi:MAG: methyltransferase [Nanoarchaeota archaeon]|nr:methyltransferase [Nanoarchaeota archaeon]
MYNPAEDSFLLSEQIKLYLSKFSKPQLSSIHVLDMGSGSGIQAKTCIKSGISKKNILCSDIDSEVIKHLKSKKLITIKSNLFKNIKQKFDLIIFNPPYLPESEHDKQKDTTGGKQGDETIIKFLKQAKSHLEKKGKILLLTSSFTPMKKINQLIKKLNYKKIKLTEKNIFFEKLYVWEIIN